MENLIESVYECTLGVEAHMICDLLARAGISSRVDGEFLAGAGGELPLGSTIKVRVDPSRAVEARVVIDEWEKLQPPPGDTAALARRPIWSSPLWFFFGVVVGGVLLLIALRSPYSTQSVDLDGDGRVDETYFYSGQTLDAIKYDRNADGKIDALWVHDLKGVPKRYESDDDFDGTFEWRGDVERGWVARNVMDANRDGRPERIQNSHHGVLRMIEVYDAEGTRVVVREHYDNARLEAREVDQDGDGVFERRVDYDNYGEPVARLVPGGGSGG
jgi:hypothetical protein